MKQIQAELKRISKYLYAIDTKGIDSDLGKLKSLGQNLEFYGSEIYDLSLRSVKSLFSDEMNFSENNIEDIEDYVKQVRKSSNNLDKVLKKLKSRKL